MQRTGYIAGIARGHNAGVCLLKDGEIVFSIEEHLLVIHAAAKTLSYQRRATQRFEMKGVSQNTNQHNIRSLH